jgi:hypothetical protein
VSSRYYLEGLFLPAELAPELKRLTDQARRASHPSAALGEWLRSLDSTVTVHRRGVRPSAGRFAGWLTVAQAAQEMGQTDRHVRRMCVEGRVAGAEKDGRDWRIPPGSLARLHRHNAIVAMSVADRSEQRMNRQAAA